MGALPGPLSAWRPRTRGRALSIVCTPRIPATARSRSCRRVRGRAFTRARTGRPGLPLPDHQVSLAVPRLGRHLCKELPASDTIHALPGRQPLCTRSAADVSPRTGYLSCTHTSAALPNLPLFRRRPPRGRCKSHSLAPRYLTGSPAHRLQAERSRCDRWHGRADDRKWCARRSAGNMAMASSIRSRRFDAVTSPSVAITKSDDGIPSPMRASACDCRSMAGIRAGCETPAHQRCRARGASSTRCGRSPLRCAPAQDH